MDSKCDKEDSVSASSIYNLEQQAREQRVHIHETAHELASKIEYARQKLDVTYNLRKHFLTGSLITAGLAYISGYSVGGTFTRR